MTDSSFKDFLQEYIDIKGLSVKKLSDATGIPERYVIALIEGNNEDMPPAPYVRGYIGKLASVLDFDKEEMWRRYKKDADLNGSGHLDKMPVNRYAIKKINKKIILSGALGILVVIYFGWNINKLLGTPKLELTYPVTENLIVSKPIVSIEGKTEASIKLTMNDADVFVDEDGRFQKDYSLDIGLNIINITVKKFLGKEVEVIRKIIYQPPVQETIYEEGGEQ